MIEWVQTEHGARSDGGQWVIERSYRRSAHTRCHLYERGNYVTAGSTVWILKDIAERIEDERESGPPVVVALLIVVVFFVCFITAMLTTGGPG